MPSSSSFSTRAEMSNSNNDNSSNSSVNVTPKEFSMEDLIYKNKKNNKYILDDDEINQDLIVNYHDIWICSYCGLRSDRHFIKNHIPTCPKNKDKYKEDKPVVEDNLKLVENLTP
jgi:rubrerythrin